jgi:hypothetical protein
MAKVAARAGRDSMRASKSAISPLMAATAGLTPCSTWTRSARTQPTYEFTSAPDGSRGKQLARHWLENYSLGQGSRRRMG